jgi:acyl carrier protein
MAYLHPPIIVQMVTRNMNPQEVREKLRLFIIQDLIRDDEYELKDDEGIITGGLMDSFALAEYAVFVESEFGLYIPDAELTVANMDSLDQMVARVLKGSSEG